jgi:hypothetical protein
MSLRARGEQASPWPYHAVISGQPVMLARLSGEPSWTETKIRYFDQSSLITSTDRNYQMFPPEVEFPYAQERWTGGAGHADQHEGDRDSYWYADGVDCSGGWPIRGPQVNTVSAAAVSGSVSQFIEFNSKLYCIADDRIYVRTDDTVSAWTNLTPGTDFAANVGQCAVFQGTQANPFLFIPIGSGANYYVMSTAEAFTQHASRAAVAFATVGNELWLAAKESNQWVIRKAEDGGTTATWGAAITVGDTVASINRLQNVDNRLLVHKDDGVFGVSIEAFTIDEPLTPELRNLTKASNGKVATVWNGSDIFTMDGNLFRYAPSNGELAQIGPELTDRNTSPVKGPVVAIDGQAGIALWAFIYNSVTGYSHLARYGAWQNTPKGNVFLPVWHYSLWKTNKVVTTCFVSTGVYLGTPQPRLYIGCSDGTVYYLILSKTSNPLDDPAYRFDTTAAGGDLYLTRYTANFPFEDKLIKAVGVGGRSLNGTAAQITASYKVASDSSYTSIGSVTEDPGERVNVSGNVATPAVDFKLNFVTTSSSATPVLTHFVIYSTLRTTNLKRITATIVAGDGVLDLAGKPLRYTWRDLRTALENAMTTNGAFTVINPAGEEVTVIGLDFGHGYVPSSDDEKRGQRWTEQISMIQTQAANNRGTWDRAAAYTWSSLSAFRWSDVAIL